MLGIAVPLTALLLSVLLVLLPPAGNVQAQPGDESAEEAVIGMYRYRLSQDVLPAGVEMAYDIADSADSFAANYVLLPPSDPRPAQALLAPLVSSGFVVRYGQVLRFEDGDTTRDLDYRVVLFRDAAGAAKALRDPSLATYIQKDDQLEPAAAPSLGEEAFRYRYIRPLEGSYRTDDLIIWRRGRLAFLVFGEVPPPTTPDASVPLQLARRADAFLARQPQPPTFGPSASYLPSAARRLDLLQQLATRLLPDGAFAPLETEGGAITVSNPFLQALAQGADALGGPRPVLDLLVTRERRITGLSQNFLPSEGAGPRPEVALGYEVYADSDGAGEAVRETGYEVGLHVYQQFDVVPSVASFEEIPPFLTLDTTSRLLKHTFENDGEPFDVVTMRWRRGAVGLFASVIVDAGADYKPLLRQAVEQLDATYVGNPLPGAAVSQPISPTLVPSPSARPPAQAPAQLPRR